MKPRQHNRLRVGGLTIDRRRNRAQKTKGDSRVIRGEDGQSYEITNDLPKELGNAQEARTLRTLLRGSGKGRVVHTAATPLDPAIHTPGPRQARQYHSGESERSVTSADLAGLIDSRLISDAGGFRFKKKPATTNQNAMMERLIVRFGQWLIYAGFFPYPSPPLLSLASIWSLERKDRLDRAAKSEWDDIRTELGGMGFHGPLSVEELYDALTIEMLYRMESEQLAGPPGYRRDYPTAKWVFSVAKDRLTNCVERPWWNCDRDWSRQELDQLIKLRAAFLIGLNEWRAK